MRFSDPLHAPAATRPCQLRDHRQWRQGRERYWLWSIALECPSILARMQAARERLGDWLHPPGQRQAHITLFVCGFANATPRLNDDITPATLEAQRRALDTLDMPPFELRIGGLDSFAGAAFLDVEHAEPLERLRTTLASLAPEVRQAPYVPHLTIGLYRRAVSLAQWRERAEPLCGGPALQLPVDQLQLLSYAAAEPQGALRIEARIKL